MSRTITVAVLTGRQLFKRATAWLFPVLLMASSAWSLHAGMNSWRGVYLSAPSSMCLAYFPLLICAGVVSDELTSGRVLMLHAARVKRREFILGRLLGAGSVAVASVLAVQITLAAYFAASARIFEFRILALVAFASIIYMIYLTILLVFLSTWIPSWGNSAVVFLLQLTFGIINDFSTHGFRYHEEIRWVTGTLLFGPNKMLRGASAGVLPELKDLLFVLCTDGLFLLASLWLYSRKEIAPTVLNN